MILGQVYQDKFCAWFSFARLPTEKARELFLDYFLKETALSFFFLLLDPVQCLHKTFFVRYLFLSNLKHYLNSQNFPPFKIQREKLCNVDVNRASVF